MCKAHYASAVGLQAPAPDVRWTVLIRGSLFDSDDSESGLQPHCRTVLGFKILRIARIGGKCELVSAVRGDNYPAKITRNGILIDRQTSRQPVEFQLSLVNENILVTSDVLAGAHVAGVYMTGLGGGIRIPASSGCSQLEPLRGFDEVELFCNFADKLVSRSFVRDCPLVPVIFNSTDIQFVGADNISVSRFLIPSQRFLSRRRVLLDGLALSVGEALTNGATQKLLETVMDLSVRYSDLHGYYKQLKHVVEYVKNYSYGRLVDYVRDYVPEFDSLVLGSYLYRAVRAVRSFYTRLVDEEFTDSDGVTLDSLDPALTLKRIQS